MRNFALMICLTVFASCACCIAPSTKKLIETGWNMPQPWFLKQNIAKMQSKPFDGMVLRGTSPTSVFSAEPHPNTGYVQDTADLTNLAWGRFTENYLLIHASPEGAWDWFDNTHWAATLENVRRLSQVIKAGSLRGVVFDMEPYGFNPWDYAAQTQKATQSFGAYQAKVKARGQAFIETLQSTYPGVQVLAYFLLSINADALEGEPSGVNARLETDSNGLWASFVAGMLEAANDNVRLLEGNEFAYYYLHTAQFDAAKKTIQDYAPLLEPGLRSKYLAQVGLAQAIYADGVMNLHNSPRFCGYYFKSDTERLQVLEHNVFNAMRTSDSVAWFYNEKMDWWNRQGQGEKIPAGIEAAVARARSKAQNNQPLGFDLEPIVKTAEAACNAKKSVGGDLIGVTGSVSFEVILNGQALNGEPFCGTWNANTRFSCTFPGGNQTYSITPKLAGKTFDPPSRTFSNLSKDDWSLVFTAK